MSPVSVVALAVISAACATLMVLSALKSKHTSPREIALYGAALVVIGSGALVYQLVLTTMLGKNAADFLFPSVLGSRAERSVPVYYAIAAGGLAMMITAVSSIGFRGCRSR